MIPADFLSIDMFSITTLKYQDMHNSFGEHMEGAADIREIIEHRARDYNRILEAIRIQDAIRKKAGGKKSEDMIREWRDSR